MAIWTMQKCYPSFEMNITELWPRKIKTAYTRFSTSKRSTMTESPSTLAKDGTTEHEDEDVVVAMDMDADADVDVDVDVDVVTAEEATECLRHVPPAGSAMADDAAGSSIQNNLVQPSKGRAAQSLALRRASALR